MFSLEVGESAHHLKTYGFSHYINEEESMNSYYGGKNQSKLHPQLGSTA